MATYGNQFIYDAIDNSGFLRVARQSKPKVAMVGSSYVSNGHRLTGNDFESTSRSWLDWFNGFTGLSFNTDTFVDSTDPLGRGFWGANQGVSGQTSTQILARLGSTINSRPDIVIVQSGANNIGAPTTVLADNKEIINRLWSAGILVVYTAISARSTGEFNNR